MDSEIAGHPGAEGRKDAIGMLGLAKLTRWTRVTRLMRTYSLVGAFALALVVSTQAAHAAPGGTGSSHNMQPNIYPCQFVHYVDKKGGSYGGYDPASGGGYTLTVYASFAYDNYFGGEYCWTRSHAVIQESGNLYNGTLYMTLTDCSNQVDSVQRSFPGGGGTFNEYGNNVGAGCAEASAYLVAANGYRVPSGYNRSDSGRELS